MCGDPGHIRHTAASVQRCHGDDRRDIGRGAPTATMRWKTPARRDEGQRVTRWMDETSAKIPSATVSNCPPLKTTRLEHKNNNHTINNNNNYIQHHIYSAVIHGASHMREFT